jgi:hypothetical protein
VEVTDVFPEKSFEVKSGTPHFKLERLEGGANYTSRLVLVPKVAGKMTVGRAEVRYNWLPRDELDLEEEGEEGSAAAAAAAAAKRAAANIEESAELQLSQSSSQGKVDILSPEAFARHSKNKQLAPLLCLAAAMAAILLPYSLYTSAQAHAEQTAAHKHHRA